VTRRLRKKIARFLGKVAKKVAKNKQQKITCKKVAQKVAKATNPLLFIIYRAFLVTPLSFYCKNLLKIASF
jgi:hypothetical protein